MSRSFGEDPEALGAFFLCSPDKPRRKTGTPLPVDAPYPAVNTLIPTRILCV